ILKYGVIGYMVFCGVRADVSWLTQRDIVTWYGGTWNVAGFARDGRDVPALVTDTARWGRVRFQDAPSTIYVRWRFMDDSAGSLYTVALDETQQTMTFAPSDLDKPKVPSGPLTFRYTRVDPDHLTLEGKADGVALTVQLERLDA